MLRQENDNQIMHSLVKTNEDKNPGLNRGISHVKCFGPHNYYKQVDQQNCPKTALCITTIGLLMAAGKNGSINTKIKASGSTLTLHQTTRRAILAYITSPDYHQDRF